MEYLLITEDLVGKIVCASYGHDNSLDLEVLEPKQLPIERQHEYGFISDEEFYKAIEEKRKAIAIHAIKEAKQWIKQYPDLA